VTDEESFARAKHFVSEGLGCLLTEGDIAWLVLRVEQLEKEVQNLRDALASS
jgi:hypothetical protein